MLEQLKNNKQDYVWKLFKTPENVGRARMMAMEHFLMDYNCGRKEGRYIGEKLPRISFKDGQFDIAICSHFLFLYSDHLSFSFHVKAITEMLRVAKEVRIFPLLQLGGKESPYVKNIIMALREKGHEVAVSKVNYEFARGGNKMLSICSKNG